MLRSKLSSALLAISLLAMSCSSDSTDEVASESTATSASTTSTVTTTVATSTSLPTDNEEQTMTSLELGDYPFWENSVATESQAALDAFAADYVDQLGDDEAPEVERFLFGSLPTVIFDEIFSGTNDERRAELFWLLHLSGYFGGRWLRGEIADAQPDALLVGFSMPPTEDAFAGIMARAQTRLDTLGGDDAAIIAAARSALFDTPPQQEGEEAIAGLADSFGYNVGYMLEILATPPEGVVASPQYEVTCNGLLDCAYTSPKLAILTQLGDIQAALNSENPPDPELVAALIPVQDAAEPRGRAVWSGGLSVQGFSQKSYDQLLDVSSSFLETVQATALVNVQAVAEGNVDAARTGLIAEAAQIVWLGAYLAGLTNGEGTIELPAFGR